MADFTSPKVERGRLTNKRTKEFLTFHLNPTPLKHSSGSHFVEDPTPGFSHPLRRWASGKPEAVSFKMELDGDISFRRFGTVLDNPLNPTSDKQPFSVQGFIDWLLAFNHPTSQVTDIGGNGANDLGIFNYGSMYRNWPCTVEVTSVELMEFDVNLIPTRAHVEMTLTKVVIASETYGLVWQTFA